MKKYILMLMLVIATSVSAQWDAEQISASPTAAGMGRTGVASHYFDAGVINYNPALAGYFAKENNFGFVGTLSSQNAGFTADPSQLEASEYSSNSFFAGYNFNIPGMASPISLGLQYSHYSNTSTYGDYFGLTTDEVDYQSDFISIGASVEYGVVISAGYSFNNKSRGILRATSVIDSIAYFEYNDEVSSNSIGLHISKNLADFIPESYKRFNPSFGNIEYSLNLALGCNYNTSNEDNGLDYFATGYSVNFELFKKTDYSAINMFELGFAAEAEIELGRDDSVFDLAYGRTVIGLKSESGHTTNLGSHIGIYETLYFNFGFGRKVANYFALFNLNYIPKITTQYEHKSIGFSTAGFSKTIAEGLNKGALKTILNNVSFTYHNVKYEYFDGTDSISMFQLNLKTVL